MTPTILLYCNTSNDWFGPHLKVLANKLVNLGFPVTSLNTLEELEIHKNENVICFILACTQIIPQDLIKNNLKNIVIHESDLPKGKGWSPLSWQIEEGSNTIVFSAFEASNKVDDGDIVLQKTLKLEGTELLSDIKHKQAELTLEMVIELSQTFPNWNKRPQTGTESFYSKRTVDNDELDIKITLERLFNKLRITNNQDFPAWFEINNTKYSIKIEKID